MHFGFVRYRFFKCRFARSKIYTFRFVYFQDVLKTSSRLVFKTPSRYGFRTSSRHVFKTSSRRLQPNNFSSSKTSRRRLQDVLQDAFKTFSRRLCKTSSRRLGRRKIVTLNTCWRRLQDMSWRRLQDVLNTNKCLLGLNFNCIPIFYFIFIYSYWRIISYSFMYFDDIIKIILSIRYKI